MDSNSHFEDLNHVLEFPTVIVIDAIFFINGLLGYFGHSILFSFDPAFFFMESCEIAVQVLKAIRTPLYSLYPTFSKIKILGHGPFIYFFLFIYPPLIITPFLIPSLLFFKVVFHNKFRVFYS